MSIKMRVLVSSGKGKMMTLAESIKKEFELGPNAVDKIPSAYPCDKERIVIIAVSSGDTPKNDILNFCKDLNKERTANVAILIDGSETAANVIKETLKSAGTNVIDEVFTTKCGMSFLKSVKPEETTAMLKWAHSVVKQLK